MEMPGPEGGLDGCKEECNKDESCTAIEYSSLVLNSIDNCILRKCPVPVPEPDVIGATHGFPEDSIQDKFVGYVKRKYILAILIFFDLKLC